MPQSSNNGKFVISPKNEKRYTAALLALGLDPREILSGITEAVNNGIDENGKHSIREDEIEGLVQEVIAKATIDNALYDYNK